MQVSRNIDCKWAENHWKQVAYDPELKMPISAGKLAGKWDEENLLKPKYRLHTQRSVPSLDHSSFTYWASVP